MQQLFLTGTYRSGTTLMDKLLSSHPEMVVASQPFPFLLFRFKSDFYEQNQINRRYPLDHLFGESDYSPEDLLEFLQNHKLSGQEVVEVMTSMHDYSGHWTRETLEYLDRFEGGTLAKILQSMHGCYPDLFNRTNLKATGSKEILAEEYIPYLVANGFQVILMIRDVRDVIASLTYGSGPKYTGQARPILYTVRAWRKSVAFALELINDPNVHIIRFEDFIREPGRTLEAISEQLGIAPFTKDLLNKPILDQFGRTWKGNSSFGNTAGITNQSIGRFRSLLDRSTVEFIETLAAPEMGVMGYPAITKNIGWRAIERYREPFALDRADFPANYSYDPKRLSVERQRLGWIKEKRAWSESLQPWFIFRAAYEKLIDGSPLFNPNSD